MKGTVSITHRQRDSNFGDRDAFTAGSMLPPGTSLGSEQATVPGTRNDQVYARYRTSSMVPPLNFMRHGSTADNTSPRP